MEPLDPRASRAAAAWSCWTLEIIKEKEWKEMKDGSEPKADSLPLAFGGSEQLLGGPWAAGGPPLLESDLYPVVISGLGGCCCL